MSEDCHDSDNAAGPPKDPKREAGGAHYGKMQPWDLQKAMPTSGDAFVDSRRSDAIKYCFRKKGGRDKMIDDLEKAKHCIEAALSQLKNPDLFPEE